MQLHSIQAFMSLRSLVYASLVLLLISCGGSGSGPDLTFDVDGDGVQDSQDAFPQDASESKDSDGDGIGDNSDSDDDNDGLTDLEELNIGSNQFLDDSDYDGVQDGSDLFPLDGNESLDFDLDGLGNNVDVDDDNDGVADINDSFPFDGDESTDTDADLIGDNSDQDDDGDEVLDVDDAFPLDPSESLDTDGDGVGNNADLDDDGDGVPDLTDVFPLDPYESLDTDGDGVGNNADLFPTNIAPTVNAGIDQTVSGGEMVTLSGVGNDSDGTIMNYEWSQLGGSNFVINNANTGTATFLAPVQLNSTTYELKLTVTDDDGESEIDIMLVIVNKTINTTSNLNDTGITWGGNFPDGNNTTCVGETVEEQDCSYGRDAQAAAGILSKVGGGHAGFDFTKLDSSGNPLISSSSNWDCVKDNHTSLIWEVKKGGNGIRGDEGLHDADDRYNWYNTDPASNGGAVGYADNNGAICSGYAANNAISFCNTEAYTARVNAAGYCGYNDWRLPTTLELVSLVSNDRVSPSIDTDYFPKTSDSSYWSSSAVANTPSYARNVFFSDGYSGNNPRYGDISLRLVRSGQ